MTLTQYQDYEILVVILDAQSHGEAATRLCTTDKAVAFWLHEHELANSDLNGRCWQQEHVMEMLTNSPLTQSDIADLFGCTQTTVSRWINKFGLNERPWTDAERLRESYVDRGMSDEAIADHWGCTPQTIHNWLDRHGIERHRVDEIAVPEKIQQAVSVQTTDQATGDDAYFAD